MFNTLLSYITSQRFLIIIIVRLNKAFDNLLVISLQNEKPWVTLFDPWMFLLIVLITRLMPSVIGLTLIKRPMSKEIRVRVHTSYSLGKK